MEEVLHADIFFFITSMAVVVFTVLVCVALYFIIKILRSVSRIVTRIEEGSEVIVEDISQLRRFIAEGSLISQIIGMFMRGKNRVKSRRASSREEGTNADGD